MAKFNWDKVAKEDLDRRHREESLQPELDYIDTFKRNLLPTNNGIAVSVQRRKIVKSSASTKSLVRCQHCESFVKPGNVLRHHSKMHSDRINKHPTRNVAPGTVRKVNTNNGSANLKAVSVLNTAEITPAQLSKELEANLPNAIIKLARSVGAEIKSENDPLPIEVVNKIRRFFKIPV